MCLQSATYYLHFSRSTASLCLASQLLNIVSQTKMCPQGQITCLTNHRNTRQRKTTGNVKASVLYFQVTIYDAKRQSSQCWSILFQLNKWRLLLINGHCKNSFKYGNPDSNHKKKTGWEHRHWFSSNTISLRCKLTDVHIYPICDILDIFYQPGCLLSPPLAVGLPEIFISATTSSFI